MDAFLRALHEEPEFSRIHAENKFMATLDWTPEQTRRYNERLSDLAYRCITWRPSKNK